MTFEVYVAIPKSLLRPMAIAFIIGGVLVLVFHALSASPFGCVVGSSLLSIAGLLAQM